MGNELMTGFVSHTIPQANPLSIVTIQSLRDQGYSVDITQADAYTLTLGLRAAATGKVVPFGDDQARVPLRLVDAQGRVVRIIQP
jgi:hypothetical protein